MFCPVCSSLALKCVAVERGDDGNDSDAFLGWCSNCDLHFSPRIVGYDAGQDVKLQQTVNVAHYKAAFRNKNFDTEMEVYYGIIAKFVPFLSRRDKFVEIGVGLGMLTRTASSLFQIVHGLDFEIDTAIESGPVPSNVYFQLHSAYLATATSIDALCAWHVVEHLARPHETLWPLFSRMPIGAAFFGQVPLFRNEYVMKAHYVFYSERAIITLCKAYGFRPVYLERDEVNNFLSFCFRKWV